MSLSLLGWRRTVARLYADVRSAAGPAAGHELWCDVRNDLFAHHPDSPIPVGQREAFTGLQVASYDSAYRFDAAVDTDVPPQRMEVETGTDGVVPFERVGVVHLDGVGSLDVWWLDSYGGGIFVPLKDGSAGRVTYG